jgi:hypothetical protein
MNDESLDVSRDTRFTETIKQDIYSLIEEYEHICIDYSEDSNK